MHIHSYPKVYNLGHAALSELFLDPVVVQEKVDGSQLSFCVDDDGVHFRSKSMDFDPGYQDNMFNLAVESVMNIASQLTPGHVYRGEYLRKKKHNTLVYNRVPNNHIVLFDIEISEQNFMSWNGVQETAKSLGLEPVPIMCNKTVGSYEELEQYLERESTLGGPTVEGVVVKNYHRYDRSGHCLMGKYVSEKFRERHTKDWKLRNPSGSDIREAIGHELHTEARWEKAIQHLRDRGELQNAPQDIGPLIKEIHLDVLAEEKEAIMEQLFKWAWKDVTRAVVRGFPEWYKERLARSQFDDC